MNMYDIIIKKRNGHRNTDEELEFLISEYINGNIPDYQVSAWLMAVYFSGMEDTEAAKLTELMASSGDMMDLSPIHGAKVDKHSSGGVGDKTTLILGPLVASCGLKVGKMSGRGLGHTGGTLDKLESIPGFQINMSGDRFFDIVNKTGLAVVGQTGNLAPADKKFYALRDVTATVDSIPLIAGSIMSKKLAAGNDGIVLDVKCGKGAFMQNLDDAETLARLMVEIGKHNGRSMSAVISNMDQPLGRKVGNSLEVEESIDTLRGNGPEDLTELCIELGNEMLSLGNIGEDSDDRKKMLKENLENGKALEKFREMIRAQGGDDNVIDDFSIMGKAENIFDVKLSQKGFVKGIDALSIGKAAMHLGAGRAKKEDNIDPVVGIELLKKTSDYISEDDTIARVYYNGELKEEIITRIRDAYDITEANVEKPELIYNIVR